MIARIPGKVFPVVLLALCIPAAWLLGEHQMRERTAQQLDQLQSSSEQDILRLQAAVSTLEADRQRLTLSLDIANSRAAALQAELDSMIGQSIDDASELALYRRIAGAETEKGLLVDALRRVGVRSDVLSLTLIQAQGRDRASGDIAVTFVSSPGGVKQRWALVDGETGALKNITLTGEVVSVPPDETEISYLADRVVKVASYDLRFFQTLLVTVGNITTIDPELVEIWILPSGKEKKPEIQRFSWSEIPSVVEQ